MITLMTHTNTYEGGKIRNLILRLVIIIEKFYQLSQWVYFNFISYFYNFAKKFTKCNIFFCLPSTTVHTTGEKKAKSQIMFKENIYFEQRERNCSKNIAHYI